MYLPLGTFSPEVKIGLVSASRNCFPRLLSEQRRQRLFERTAARGITLFVPEGDSSIIESKRHAADAARQMRAAGCDAAVLYLGNFSPEIEDAGFMKAFPGPVMLLAAAEESRATLRANRGDALCGLLSAALAIKKRGLMRRAYLPADPIVTADSGATAIGTFLQIMKVYKGIRGATIGLFGPRPRDFETCHYNLESLASLGVEVEELSLFDLVNEVKRLKEGPPRDAIQRDMRSELPNADAEDFLGRLASYEQAVLNFRERLSLSGATTQCWSEQELSLRHVPCYINARLAGRGFPIACENDAYSLVAELMGQYASDGSVTILDLNHSIPADLHGSLAHYRTEDCVGLFHCGNTDLKRLKDPTMKHQVIMKRLMEPEGPPDITRGTIEGQIAASPITLVQIHGAGDRMSAYVAEGQFLDLDPMTFGCTGTAYIPGFRRFYRHVLLGRFHHHAAVAFSHCGGVLVEALRLLGVEDTYTPLPSTPLYPGENPFACSPAEGHP